MLGFIAIIQQFLKTLLLNFILIYHIFNLKTCECTKYPVCILEPNEPASHCLDFEITIKTKKDKQDILDKINSRRDKVASGVIRSLPSAGNMMKMEWNESLEISAQRWANQCVPYKELDTKDICSLSDNFDIGQNIATLVGDSPGLSPAILVDLWYMELLNMNSTFVSRYRPSNQTDLQHYDYFTQLVWAQSYQVGCGGIKFKEITDKNMPKKTINRLVCNFTPEGNLVEKPVYTDGFPCSECPYNSICDSVYSSLCSFKFKMNEKKNYDNEKAIERFKNFPSVNSYKINYKQENATTHYLKNTSIDLDVDDNVTSFDYFANLYHSVVSTEKITTNRIITCKDIMPVEDFIDIFKKRLMKDQELRDYLFKNKPSENKENSDSGYTDVSVANFMSQIHSKKVISTTAQSTEPDYSNSTLLADLVEAVILKNNDEKSTPEKEEQNANVISDVSAVKIKAEFGKIKTNSFSTGHYFFPVEYDEEDSKETTELVYDMSSIGISDIVLEIEELKRNKGTKDFLEEILDSESSPEVVSRVELPSPTTYYLNENGSEESLEYSAKSVEKKSLHRNKRSEEMKTGLLLRSFKKKKSDVTTQLVYYRDILKKIASDIGILKLNERFHCAGKCSLLTFIKLELLIFCFILTFNLIDI